MGLLRAIHNRLANETVPEDANITLLRGDAIKDPITGTMRPVTRTMKGRAIDLLNQLRTEADNAARQL